MRFLFAITVAAILLFSLFPPESLAVVEHGTAITDPVGRTVTISIPANRVLLALDVLPNYAILNGSMRGVVGITEDNLRTMAASPIVEGVFPGADRIPVVGLHSTDPEAVMALNPDAALTWWSGSTPFLESVHAPGLVVFPQSNPARTIDFRLLEFRYAALVSDQMARAAILLQHHDAEERKLLAEIPKPEKKLQVADLSSFNDHFIVNAGNSAFSEFFSLLGAENVALKTRLWLGSGDLERLILLDPDIIFLDQARNEPTTSVPEEFYAQPEMQLLRAVRERKVYRVPFGALVNEVADGPLLWRWMAEIFYPEAMPHDFRNQVKQTYRDILHYPVTDDELDAVLSWQDNRASYGYKRFARENGS